MKNPKVIVKKDKANKFVSMFNPETGFYMRTGVLENGKDTGVDPFMTNYPELIDIGVMGFCVHGSSGLCKGSGVQCYQSGFSKSKPNMSLYNFRKIIEESKGKVFQVALGGRGDVNKHEHFEELLKICRENNIVPNYTTSGFGMTHHEAAISKKYCGAIAVSWYRNNYTLEAINDLIAQGCKTNIHYVLGNFSIDEAIDRLTNDSFPEGVNAVVFLMHKPVGQGGQKDVLNPNDPKVKEFFKIVDNYKGKLKIGFDSCSVPAILNFTENIDKKSIDTCEGGRWSMYISADMVALPCSFDQEHKWGVDISKSSVKEAWDSFEFESFRNSFRNSCSGCSVKNECMGGCPIKREIVLCDKTEKNHV